MILIASSPILADEEPADLPTAAPWDMPRMSAMSDMRSTIIDCEYEIYKTKVNLRIGVLEASIMEVGF